ncbi:MAG: hypothetical protein AAGH83_03090 [Pseudomonadota bacterium]
MSNGSFEDFRDALRAFESGWDRDRYEAGIIADWQLNQWAGGTVNAFFPNYTSWGDLTAAEWDAMSYRSTNSLGFVGYQFGEALLIDLGYYDDDLYYGNGAATNTWDGTWTGKNGVGSLDEFMTEAAQEVAIQEAFGFNLQIIETQLGYQGRTLTDFIDQTFTYQDVDGSTVNVTMTLTGLMAAAHLRGAYGTATLLLGGGASTDEYGTSILQYVEQFGGYDSPSVADAIAFYEDRKTGDEGIGSPGGNTGGGDTSGGSTGGGDTGGSGNAGGVTDGSWGSAGVTAASADVVVTWAWGLDDFIESFDPASDTIFISWVSADQLDITEITLSDGRPAVVFAIASNNQSQTLAGVSLDDLSEANFTALDTSTQSELSGLVGEGSGGGHGGGDGHGDGGDTGDGHGGGNGNGDGHGGGNGHTHMHVQIAADTPGQTIDGFMPAMGDVIELGGDIGAENFTIFEESGDALGQTVRIEIAGGGTVTQHIFTGFGLSDLSISNFSIANQAVLNEVAAALGAIITVPNDGGYDLTYDTDGSNPAATTGPSDAGGTKWRADFNADDIVGFNPDLDEIDVGGTSVHGMILTKSQSGEIVIDSPWSDAAQIVQGVTYQDITIDNFSTVGNEHFRQDIGGVLSWELGIGPRETDTIYVRSHEYGVSEVVNTFDPDTMKISFLYFGTRERLSVEDTAEGLVISSLPTGQSLTLTGVTLADLDPSRLEFHHDQVIEDNLEVPFGFAQDDVTLVDRTVLLTPDAPPGQTTDGWQTTDPTDPADPTDPTDPVDPDPVDPGTGNAVTLTDGTADTVTLNWSWGSTDRIVNFNPAEDVIDFNSFNAGQLSVTEQSGDLIFEVLGNGGDFTVLDGIQAEDLSADNLTAPGWNSITDTTSALIAELENLGFSLA